MKKATEMEIRKLLGNLKPKERESVLKQLKKILDKMAKTVDSE